MYNPSNTKILRRILRKNQTKEENILWQHLRNRNLSGYKFYRQYGIGAYIVDFYCPLIKLAIELDGSGHYTEAGKQADEERNVFLEGLGIKTLRFFNREIIENLYGVLECVLNEADRIKN